MVAFRPRPGLSQLREWYVAGGRQVRRGSMTFVCAEFAGSEVNFTNAHFTGETLTNAGTAGLHAR